MRVGIRGLVPLLCALGVLTACSAPTSPVPSSAPTPPPTSTPSSAAPPSPSPSPSPTVVVDPARGPGCAPDDSDQRVPTATPPGTRLERMGVQTVPVSDRTGPLVRSTEVWRCFAHTPEGAARAAVVLLAFRRGQVVHVAPGEPEMTSGRWEGAPPPFAVTGYSPAAATVDLLLASGRSGVRTTVHLHWETGDWRLYLPDGRLPSPGPAADAADFIAW